MVQVHNPARERLAKGELSLGMGIRMSRSESVAMGIPPSRWPRARLRNLHRSARRTGPIR